MSSLSTVSVPSNAMRRIDCVREKCALSTLEKVRFRSTYGGKDRENTADGAGYTV